MEGKLPESIGTYSERKYIGLTERVKGLPVCFIPAKSESAGLPQKNKLKIDGKPLYQYPIEAAKESGIFGHIWVCSDDEEILEAAYRQRVYPYKEPPGLVTGNIKELIMFCLRLMARPLPEEIAVLLPSSPFQTAEHIRSAYSLFKRENAHSLVSVTPCWYPPQWALEKRGHFIRPFYGEQAIEWNRPKRSLYWPTGAIFMAKAKAYIGNELGFYGRRTVPYIMERSFDIHTKEDFAYAEFLMQRGKDGG